MPVVAVIAPGAMGAAVGQRLAESGVEVCTLLTGRSSASAERAKAANMRPVEEAQVAQADMVLSIVPPGAAVELAQRLAPSLAQCASRAIYVDCNAVSPETVRRIGAIVSASGARFVDADIIGGPPKAGAKGPVFYASGPAAAALVALNDYGLAVKPIEGDIGAASGLKMSYAGITKGLTALASAMMLAAARFGTGDALRAELADSQPQLLAWLSRSVPGMFPKAYRWVAEMHEISDFAGEDAAARQIYQGIAQLYDRLAQSRSGPGQEISVLRALIERP
jgi:3-hydroxyisobutyrate dehydrogenase-like beta-hydroxyacid dehydrogenase